MIGPYLTKKFHTMIEPLVQAHIRNEIDCQTPLTELNVSNIAQDSECETPSEEQCNREIPGNEESSVKSSLVIDDLKPKDLKRIEGVD